AFRRESALQLVERELQRSEPFGFQMFAEDLIFTLCVVDGKTTPSDYAHTIFRLEAERANGGTEHHASDLCAAVFEGEVYVAGVPHAAVRQFPLNPHVRESVFEQH